jgi:two-component system chemotaxis response regulator CheY
MDFRQLSILGVDDTETARKLMTAALNTLHIEKIKTVGSFTGALEACITFKPDLIITDHYLESGTGLDLTEAIRKGHEEAQAIPQDIPIILITSRPTMDILEKAKTLQISAMLAKPFSPAILEQRIVTALERTGRFQQSSFARVAQA